MPGSEGRPATLGQLIAALEEAARLAGAVAESGTAPALACAELSVALYNTATDFREYARSHEEGSHG